MDEKAKFCQARHPIYRHLACSLELGHKGTHQPGRSVCPIGSCSNPRPQERMMCEQHWCTVPDEIRDRVWGTAGNPKDPDFYLSRKAAFVAANAAEEARVKKQVFEALKQAEVENSERPLLHFLPPNRAARRAHVRENRPKHWRKP